MCENEVFYFTNYHGTEFHYICCFNFYARVFVLMIASASMTFAVTCLNYRLLRKIRNKNWYRRRGKTSVACFLIQCFETNSGNSFLGNQSDFLFRNKSPKMLFLNLLLQNKARKKSSPLLRNTKNFVSLFLMFQKSKFFTRKKFLSNCQFSLWRTLKGKNK